MRRKILHVFIWLAVFTAIALSYPSLDATAIDAATDNATLPQFSGGDQSQDEIKPVQNCVLKGPSLQPWDKPPHIILSFIGATQEDNFKITANEEWHLEIDINAPGWVYIYEYFPSVDNVTGEWMAYKWEFKQGGHWKLGPFAPGENEVEGQHIYRAWFYSDGKWADDESGKSQDNLVFWTYARDRPAVPSEEQITPQAETMPPGDKLIDELRSRFTLLTALSLSLLVFIIILGSHLLWKYWRRRLKAKTLPMELPPEEPAAVPLSRDNARILLPNGIEIKIDNSNRVIGRGDLARALDLDNLGLISRRHFAIKAEDHHFYIEDLGSANGTRVNGEDISRKGRVKLSHDDDIAPAGIISLKFYLPCPPQQQP